VRGLHLEGESLVQHGDGPGSHALAWSLGLGVERLANSMMFNRADPAPARSAATYWRGPRAPGNLT